MDSRLEKLNEKILLVTKLIEQNKDNIRNNSLDEEEEKSINDKSNKNFFKTNINIDKNILLKGRIETIGDDYILKMSKLKSKYDDLSNDINKLSDYLNYENESENSYNLDLIQEINNIKNNLDNLYEDENNKLEQEINYYIQNLYDKIQYIENNNISESLNEKREIMILEKFTMEIISEIINKVKLYNINSDTDKKEKSQEICKGLINDDEELSNEKNRNDLFFNDLRNKINNIIDEKIKNFGNTEENKREAFKNIILQVLNETLNKIIVKKDNK